MPVRGRPSADTTHFALASRRQKDGRAEIVKRKRRGGGCNRAQRTCTVMEAQLRVRRRMQAELGGTTSVQTPEAVLFVMRLVELDCPGALGVLEEMEEHG